MLEDFVKPLISDIHKSEQNNRIVICVAKLGSFQESHGSKLYDATSCLHTNSIRNCCSAINNVSISYGCQQIQPEIVHV